MDSSTYGPISLLLVCQKTVKISSMSPIGARQHTELLKKSLLVYAAVPATNFPAFARRAETPLTVNGSGSGIPSVSLTPSTSTSTAEGGAIVM